MPPETRFSAPAPRAGKHVVGVDFTKERMGEHNESYGTCRLHIDDQVVAEGELMTMTGHVALCGEGPCIGYDSADPVSSLYTSGFAFSGGTIKKVVFDIADDAYIDVEAHLAAAMARD